MTPELEELLARVANISELSGADLEALKGDLIAAYDDEDAKETTPENVVACQKLVDGMKAVQSRQAEIETAQAEAEAAKAEARKVRQSLDGDTEDGENADADADGTDENADADADADAVVVASGKGSTYKSSPSRMARKNDKSVVAKDETSPRAALVAAGNVGGVGSGHVFEDRYELGKTICNVLRGLSKRQSHGNVLVASANFIDLYPADRRLDDNFANNGRKIDEVGSRQALVASGGICLPVNVDWSLPTWATPERPFKAGLAQFATDHGGLTFRNPPTVAALAASNGIWTEATDFDPGAAVKPVQTIACETPTTVYVAAITNRLQFGNLMNQFDPDTITANTDLSVSAHARVAETNLLTLLQAACTLNITSAAVLGASRDWFSTIDKVVANYRYVNRLSPKQFVTIVLPEWVKSLIRADRVLEAAHDDAGADVFGVSDAWIDAQLLVRSIKAIWTLDALPVAGDASYPSQQFAGFVAANPVPAFPAKLVWNCYVEGSVQFLDGGLLNLGVVRDATLDATNDYETFMETFEGLAYRGFGGGAMQIVSTLTPNGESSGLSVH